MFTELTSNIQAQHDKTSEEDNDHGILGNVDRLQVQLEEGGSSSTRQSWMETVQQKQFPIHLHSPGTILTKPQ